MTKCEAKNIENGKQEDEQSAIALSVLLGISKKKKELS
jgi:hypothetical protein